MFKKGLKYFPKLIISTGLVTKIIRHQNRSEDRHKIKKGVEKVRKSSVGFMFMLMLLQLNSVRKSYHFDRFTEKYISTIQGARNHNF